MIEKTIMRPCDDEEDGDEIRWRSRQCEHGRAGMVEEIGATMKVMTEE